MPTKNKEITSLNSLKNKKNVLIITSCSKNKLDCEELTEVRAKEMYQGTLFKKVRTYAEAMNFDYQIISAKYGLVRPDDPIIRYNQRLQTNGDVEKIRPDVEAKLRQDLSKYDTIVVIAGERYRQVLENLVNENFVFIKAKGIGDMIHIVSKAIPENKELCEI